MKEEDEGPGSCVGESLRDSIYPSPNKTPDDRSSFCCFRALRFIERFCIDYFIRSFQKRQCIRHFID